MGGGEARACDMTRDRFRNEARDSRFLFDRSIINCLHPGSLQIELPLDWISDRGWWSSVPGKVIISDGHTGN